MNCERELVGFLTASLTSFIMQSNTDLKPGFIKEEEMFE